MELVTGAMGSLLPKLGELLKEEYGLQKGMKKKIEKLSRELRAVHAVLRKIGDVPPDQIDELVRLWVRDIREASYDMEDIVDAFLVRVVDFPNQEPTRLVKKVGQLFKRARLRRKISNLVQDINKKLEEVAARRDRYTLDNIVANPVPATTIDPRILNLYKRATELVGLEGPRDELINMLSLGNDVDESDVHLSDNKKMKIVSIVGFGGLGKTTLAKAVYDHLKPRFECRAFVPVGRDHDIKKVFRDILMGLDQEKYTYSKLKGLDEHQLMDKLNEFVKEKRYLIVIDDIWDKESLKFIRCALPESNCGSRLVITTRNSEVATGDGEAYKIQPLSHDNSKELLYARIVDGEGKYFNSPSAEACEKILKKCGGVPLAILTIASLLASKPGEDWSEVYNSIGFGRKGNGDVDNTRKILSFSYYDLPSHLKPCLLYLSVFPEDYVIEKNSLIWKWIAEGFISEEPATASAVGLFELGEMYFNELINRNMIQPQENENDGYVDACSVHDMVLDLIHQLSSDENFVTVLNGGERQKLQGSISRRLALHCLEDNAGQLANIDVEKVRSVFASEWDICALWPRLPFLHVVETTDSEGCDEDVLCHLGSLLHLRYLKLNNDCTRELPREVRYPRFLQTLDLSEGGIKELPEEVGLLTQLVCLRLGIYSTTKVSTGLIGKLTSLQELSIWCDEDATLQFVKELGLLRKLRVLQTCITAWNRKSIETALLESLGHQHNIQELQIWGSSRSEDWVSEAGSLSSCRHLRFLHLEGFVFSGLPAWIKSSLTPNLSYLDVQVVVLKDQDMEILAKLPELSCLKLDTRDTKSVVSIKIRTDEGVGYFRKLRFFTIAGSSIWFDLRGSECNSSRVASSTTIMPSLESLEFDVHVRSLKDKNLHLGFDKMLGFQNLGTSSLQRVRAEVNSRGACIRDVEEAEDALEHAAAVHPKHPTLVRGICMISRYQEFGGGAKNGAAQDFPERQGQPVCEYYLKTGTCKFGSNCKYHHPKQDGSVQSVILNNNGFPLRPGEKECSYYMKTGQCKFGSTCKFHHPEFGGIPVAPGIYPPLQSASVPSPHTYAPNWQMGRSPAVPGSYIPGSYTPMMLSSGMVPLQGWSPYPASVNPVASGGAQQTVQAGPLYGMGHHGSSTTIAYGGAYLPYSSSTGQSSNNHQEHGFPERPGQPECQYFMRTGGCKFGTMCKYNHPRDWSTPKSNYMFSHLCLPLRPGAQPCAYYAQNGYCRYGVACKYDHPMGTLGYSSSALPLSDMPIAPYPIGFSVATLAPSSSSPEYISTKDPSINQVASPVAAPEHVGAILPKGVFPSDTIMRTQTSTSVGSSSPGGGR